MRTFRGLTKRFWRIVGGGKGAKEETRMGLI